VGSDKTDKTDMAMMPVPQYSNEAVLFAELSIVTSLASFSGSCEFCDHIHSWACDGMVG
jgi:hypothetical protein